MKGVQYLVDENGRTKAVVIDLKKHSALWEGFRDLLISQQRGNKPSVSLEQVEENFRRSRQRSNN